MVIREYVIFIIFRICKLCLIDKLLHFSPYLVCILKWKHQIHYFGIGVNLMKLFRRSLIVAMLCLLQNMGLFRSRRSFESNVLY
jgi:hypothetical protein